MRKILLTIISCITSLAALLLFPMTTSAASIENFYFKSFTADYYLSRDDNGDSHLRVIEELVAVFPNFNQNHGFARVIPFTNNDGKSLTMNPYQQPRINVTRNGKTEPISRIERGDGYYDVYIGDANEYVYGEQTYVLEYEFENIILTHSEAGKTWQELYWDTNGTDWLQRFDSVTARVHFEGEEIKNAFDGRTTCYVGRYEDIANTSRCSTKEIGDGYEFSTVSLSARENLSFVIGFEADTFTTHAMPKNYLVLLPAVIMVVMTIAIIVIALVSQHRNDEKRKFYKNYFIKPEYTPPSGYTVAVAAENYLEKPTNNKMFVATLMELAVTRKIALIKNEQATTSLFNQQGPWKVRVLSTDLTKGQVSVLRMLASQNDMPIVVGMEITPVSSINQRPAYKAALRYKTYVKSELTKEGLATATQTDKYGNQNHKASKFDTAFIIYVLSGIALIVITDTIFDPEATYMNYIIRPDVLSIFMFLFLFVMIWIFVALKSNITKYDSHTKKGLELSRYLDGLKLYIKMAEAERLQMLQSVEGVDISHEGIAKIYERLLPYACLFNLEQSWINELSKYYSMSDVVKPDWYIGAATFSAKDFSNLVMAGNSFTSSRFSTSGTSGSSSSSSGFSSGGHSGGGGGGGGGHGW